MNPRFLVIALVAALGCILSPLANAQFGDFSDVPVEINADGGTRFEGGVAIAEDNVSIQYRGTHIYCDSAQYNPETREVLLLGHVRIYRDAYHFSAERAVYNLETRKLRAADVSGEATPFKLSSETLTSLSANAFRGQNTLFTTHDSAVPDYYLRARTVRVYQDDRVVFSNATLFVGQTPIFWWPYLYQSLRKDMSFTIVPGYSSNWGAYIQALYTFPIGEQASGRFRVDIMSERGIGAGLDSSYQFGKDNKSFGEFRSYIAADASPETNNTNLPRGTVDSTRYRVSLQQRAWLTEDIRADIDLNLLSDYYMLQDYFPAEFRNDPQPDTNFVMTKWDENYTLSLITRFQVNEFQETTERLPELVLDIKRQPFFNTPFFYEGEASLAFLQKVWRSETSALDNYDSSRFDTFHQIIYPRTYFDWLSVTPRLGFRATYYGKSGYYQDELVPPSMADVDQIAGTNLKLRDELRAEIVKLGQTNPGEITKIANDPALRAKYKSNPQFKKALTSGGSESRAYAIGGVEASFKLTRAWNNVESRALGLDGLRHIFQPYTDFSFVSDPGSDSSTVFQFDRFVPSTQLPPIDFPQFTSIDAVDQWTIWRFGVMNRLQTKRDLRTFNWLTFDTFFDVNIDNPYDSTDFSNLQNRLEFRPVPWASLRIDSQLPVFDSGFTEVNTSLNFMVTRNTEFRIGDRYLRDNPYFQDSNLLTFGAYYRINENWGVSLEEQYEAEDGTLEYQRYMIHRDLTSWVASLGAVLRDNGGGQEEFGFLLTFTLKDFPKINVPLNLDPQSQGSSGN